MESPREWSSMNADELRDLAAALATRVAEQAVVISRHEAERTADRAMLASRDEELKHKQLRIDQLTHEMATLKRWRYGRHSEQLDTLQRSLLDESIDADLQAISLELEALQSEPSREPKAKPRRVALPAVFPRREIRHEPDATQCSCGCALERIGVSGNPIIPSCGNRKFPTHHGKGANDGRGTATDDSRIGTEVRWGAPAGAPQRGGSDAGYRIRVQPGAGGRCDRRAAMASHPGTARGRHARLGYRPGVGSGPQDGAHGA